MRMIKQLAALGTLIFCIGVAHASANKPLTPELVERFIASMPESMALGEKHDDGQPRDIDPARPLTSSLELMTPNDAAYKDLEKLALRHDFSSVEHWANVGDRTISAYILASSTASADDVEAAYNEGVNNVKNSSDLTDSQKTAVLAGMEKSYHRNLKNVVSSEQDISAIRPHMSELHAFFE